ncbi:unnamed protein product [Clavelina lepadiformis]|uniref:NACHT domain-containing protein n=1 Tax=Clavelina lepadiformis TaxID=159417 RepID=A0ABP0FPE5_CLALP
MTEHTSTESSSGNTTNSVVKLSPIVKDAHTVIINYTQPTSKSSSDKDELDAIRKIMEVQKGFLEKEEITHPQDVSYQETPVYPAIFDVSFYDRNTILADEKYGTIHFNDLYKNKVKREVCLQDLVKQEGKFISIIGRAGCGKTFVSKRLAKSFSWPQRVCLYLSFLDINYEQPLAMRQFLLENMFPGLSEKVYADCFSWMQKNDEKLVLILDGLDKAQFTLLKDLAKINYNVCVHIKHLIFNLCCKHLFPNSLLVITSRPHRILYLPEQARPRVTYALGDLSVPDTKKLFCAIAGEALWKKIESNSCQMIAMCRNPLMLQMIVSSFINLPEDICYASTLTRLLSTVMKNLTGCHYLNYPGSLGELVPKLRDLAFNATKEGKVVLSVQQLRNADVDSTCIHDIILQLHKCSLISLFEGGTKFYFCQQLFQEHFTASYIVYEMKVEDFQVFVEESLFEDRLIFVRRFVFGILLDLERKAVSGLQMKREILKKNLNQQLKLTSEELMKASLESDYNALACKLLDLYAGIAEGKDSSIATKAAEYFPTRLYLPPSMNSNLVRGFCLVLKNVIKQLERLNMSFCHLDANSFHEIASVIKDMKPRQIGVISCSDSNLQPSNIDDIIGLLGVARDKLWMAMCFTDSRGRLRNSNQVERDRIQEALNEIQTELVVYIEGDITLRSHQIE